MGHVLHLKIFMKFLTWLLYSIASFEKNLLNRNDILLTLFDAHVKAKMASWLPQTNLLFYILLHLLIPFPWGLQKFTHKNRNNYTCILEERAELKRKLSIQNIPPRLLPSIASIFQCLSLRILIQRLQREIQLY